MCRLTNLFSCLLLALVLALPATARVAEPSERVTVFAAASLKEALDEIVQNFQAETGHEVTISLAGSSQLARQIQAGAPADIFVSANADWMDVLERDGLLVPGTRFDLAGNRLVLIAPTGGAPFALERRINLAARLGDGRLALALTKAVPAGIYARQALTGLGLWDQVVGRLAETDNVRAALALVALGEASLGVVYTTDALVEPRVDVVATFRATAHDPIVYPAARITDRDNLAADAFLAWLQGSKARAILKVRGFEVGE